MKSETMNDQKILSLKVSNVKRIRVAHIQPDGRHLVLTGENDAGKTSAMDAVTMAVEGGKSIPGKPLRDGAAKGTIDVDLTDFHIRRTFSAKGNTQLVVKRKPKGDKVSRPQSVLDQLTSSLTFDPIAFDRMSAPQQAETVRKLAGIDLTSIDNELSVLEDQRLDIGRKGRELGAKLKGMKLYENVPLEEITSEALMRELELENNKNKLRREEFQRSEAIRRSLTDTTSAIEGEKQKIATIKQQLKDAELELARLEKLLITNQADVKKAVEAFEGLPEGRPDEVTAKIAVNDENNRKIRWNQEVRKEQQTFEALCKSYTAADEAVNSKRAERAAILANSKLPIDGLEFTENGVTVGGIPFDQLGAATRLRLSAQMGIVMNPKLRVMFIRDASLMSEKSLNELMTVANDANMQVWIEQVDERAPDGADIVVFEDGAVKFEGGDPAETVDPSPNAAPFTNIPSEPEVEPDQPTTTPPPMSMEDLQAKAHEARKNKAANTEANTEATPPGFFDDEPGEGKPEPGEEF